VAFLRGEDGKANQALYLDPVAGPHLASRIDAIKAKAVEEDFARRVAEAPDRFRDQTPAPGSKEAILRGIADLQRGTPEYDRMSPSLAAKIRQDADELHAMFVSLGEVEQIFFRGVGTGGYDIYGVKFANGSAEFHILLGADGKAEDALFRPDGTDEPGSILSCAKQAGLKAQGSHSPIKIFLFNNSGEDIRLYKLDTSGARTAHAILADNTSLPVLTTMGTPWIVTDRAGQCLEILLPGQRTRYHAVEAPRASDAQAMPPRSAPQPGSEDMLRQYIDALGRGAPNYERMTAEVAAETRQSLPFDQAIVSRLGALRALSFRGVTLAGNDLYMGYFANGSAEWRISLAKDGSIARIALGPRY
jgi:hypothetical protein